MACGHVGMCSWKKMTITWHYARHQMLESESSLKVCVDRATLGTDARIQNTHICIDKQEKQLSLMRRRPSHLLGLPFLFALRRSRGVARGVQIQHHVVRRLSECVMPLSESRSERMRLGRCVCTFSSKYECTNIFRYLGVEAGMITLKVLKNAFKRMSLPRR